LVTRTSASNRPAVWTNRAAGLAWSPSGFSTESRTLACGPAASPASGAETESAGDGAGVPRCAALGPSPPRASSATSGSDFPSLAATAAATAPSTNGASHSRIRSRRSVGSMSRAISAERTALPRSIRTSTPSSDQTRSMARMTRTASVPIGRSGMSRPPTGSRRTSAPPISRASSATPSATFALCETRTMPIT
jgi:hypothetical protein